MIFGKISYLYPTLIVRKWDSEKVYYGIWKKKHIKMGSTISMPNNLNK
jgi:hypothetical protein